MLATKTKQVLQLLVPSTRRAFGYSQNELRNLQSKIDRQLKVLDMFTENREFNYEPPQMTYDKATGEINIIERKVEKKATRIIKNMDDMRKEKTEILKELGLDENGRAVDPNEPIDQYAEKLRIATNKMKEEFDIDPSNFYVFSRDSMRVDVGLMIQRPPIFLHFSKRDAEFMKFKNDLMNEYYMNLKPFADEFEEQSKMNENVLAQNPYASKMNMDNYATHQIIDEKTGEIKEYCGASKHFSRVDPNIDDKRSLHFAGEDRTYLIFKNKYTKEWEFPTGKIYFGQTFLKAKQNLFTQLSNDAWKVRYIGGHPMVATIREFTPAEQRDSLNHGLRGVRSYFFPANHYRGFPEYQLDQTDFEDFAWVPKRLLNEYFDRDYYEIFIRACLTR
ncbi:UNKNOWN [Stylonychia lemnae]|uniref:Uncharacterized protein n=1 Tax=Stylonychia lemnae TaxID=5949 RepID=A0A078APK2_STYLE|nr:UNKNOWN [Stylonychia lemnae]|eukprot:CDW83242.1 UNKNOWN [Stylonychia lemnae]